MCMKLTPKLINLELLSEINSAALLSSLFILMDVYQSVDRYALNRIVLFVTTPSKYGLNGRLKTLSLTKSITSILCRNSFLADESKNIGFPFIFPGHKLLGPA